MRVIKFRFWKNNKQQGVLELKNNSILDVAWEWDLVEQFTGLCDRLGIEIYEGDRVGDIDTGSKGYVFWDNNESQFAIKMQHGVWQFVVEDGIDKTLEVIGNIHESKGLLDEQAVE